MLALDQAIVGLLVADSDLAALLGRAPQVFLGTAPQGTALPFLLLQSQIGRSVRYIGGDRLEIPKYMLQCNANSSLIAGQVQDRIVSMFETSAGGLNALILSGSVVQVMTERGGRQRERFRDGSGNDVYSSRVMLGVYVHDSAS